MKKTILFIFVLLFSNAASADYMKALEAYRNADSKLVFSEIEDAVKTNDSYAFTLFLNELQFGYKENPDNLITIRNFKYNFSYPTVITKEKIPYLIELLEASSKTASIEYQYYFLKKRNYLLKQSLPLDDIEHYANLGVKRPLPIELLKQAKK